MLQLNIFHKAARQVKASGKSAIAITVLFVVSTSSALAALPSIGEFTSDMTKKDGLIPVYYEMKVTKFTWRCQQTTPNTYFKVVCRMA